MAAADAADVGTAAATATRESRGLSLSPVTERSLRVVRTAQRPADRGATRGPGRSKLLKNPRLMGLMLVGLGILLGGINYWSLSSNGRYYIKAMFLTPFAITYGVYLLAFGQPVDPATGKPRMWWRVGSGISLAAGLGLGGLALSYVGC